jgi:bifunctional non-homologous end joining protein LigD
MAPLARALEGLGLRSAWLDGEIVVLDEDGVPSFNALQNAFDSARTDTIRYFLFDVPHLEGYDLRAVPLRARRAALERLLEGNASDELRFSAALPGDAESVLHSACELGLEGILAKRADAPYVSARTTTWLKLKCAEQQEFVIGGYTDRSGSSAEIGSLLLGVHRDDGQLAFAGAVGTGWSSKTATELKRRLREIEIASPPFAADAPARRGRWAKRSGGAKHWVEPRLIAQVTFTEWTADGLIRHASFQGLREDKPAEAVVREAPARIAAARKARRPPDAVAGRKISNPDRVIDPSTGLRKLDLVRYYAGVAERILPHLVGRPVTLVRGPTGIEGELFFQKHDEKLSIPGIRALDPEFLPDHQPLLEIRDVEGLIGAAQMNTIELHTWNSTTRSIDRPDRMIFDLDPGKDVAWPRMQEAALLVRTMLAEIGLESWLKTSGGKGLHVVVPLVPRLDYDAVKAFSKTVVEHLARTLPSHFVAVAGPKNRIGRIYVDYVRNGLGATTAAACSARARPGLGVSMPVSWEELPSLTSGDQWSIATALEHLSSRGADPWRAYWTTRQTLTRAQKAMKGSRPRA